MFVLAPTRRDFRFSLGRLACSVTIFAIAFGCGNWLSSAVSDPVNRSFGVAFLAVVLMTASVAAAVSLLFRSGVKETLKSAGVAVVAVCLIIFWLLLLGG